MTGRRPMVGLLLPLFSGDPAAVMASARQAEGLGFDGVFAFDHLFPAGDSPDGPALEAFTSLAAVAAVTSRVALGTLVARVSLRSPGMLAKLAANLDLVSGGRAILGLGTGDRADGAEHRVFGFPDLDMDERREVLAETIPALRALFRGEAFAGGVHLPPMGGPVLPPPVRAGGPLLWVGGVSDQTVRLAGSLADGWNGWGLSLDGFGAKVGVLAEEAARAGREVEATWAGIALVGRDDAEVVAALADRRRRGMDGVAWSGTADAFGRFLEGLGAAGATWAIVVLAGPAGRRELVADRVLPRLG